MRRKYHTGGQGRTLAPSFILWGFLDAQLLFYNCEKQVQARGSWVLTLKAITDLLLQAPFHLHDCLRLYFF